MTSAALMQDVEIVSGIEAVPRILEVVCRTTGMGFAAVARVTEARWVCCGVRDEIAFGLSPGDELKVETTICNEIRASGEKVVIEDVAQDPAFCRHPTPAMYGFQSYISVPIVRDDGAVWGTLCAIDPRPAVLKNGAVTGMFELFSQLIAFHLDAQERLRASESALLDAQAAAQLREQFVAVLGHDLRTPLQTLGMGTSVLEKSPERAPGLLPIMRKSVQRMSELVDNLIDLARSRLGGGLVLTNRRHADLRGDLQQVIDELATACPDRRIVYQAELATPAWCEPPRIARLLSNLVSNALKYGDAAEPVRVLARSNDHEGLVLSVANAGPAIAPEVMQGLFEPYFRGAPQAGQEGLGLGLYIVTQIARAHGGAVDVVSDATQTRFTFRMPAAPAAHD